jgi:type I restriction enzyme M protein
VPQAIVAFLESTGFEDAIRNAISIGGDSDTIAAITGGIAEAKVRYP